MLEYTPDRHLTGGLRLAAHKIDSTARPIKRGLVPTRLILPLAQHRGAPAEPVVSVGERVLRGQRVAAAASLETADVHATTSGVVRAIEMRAVPALAGVAAAPCIVIDADGDHESIDFAADSWPEERAAQLARVRAGGIVGLGGAAYPTAAKIGAAPACRIIIINGAECEPYISCDDVLMREAPEQIVAGARLLGEIVGAEQCIIAIERDKPLAIDAIGQAAGDGGSAPRLRLAELPTIYPAGGERQLIEVLIGEEVPAGRYPSDIALLCQNVGTAFAVHRLAAHGEPLLSRIVTVAGRGVATAQNVEVPIGTPVAELIAFCGGYREGARRLLHGGSMMGYALPNDDMPVAKGTSCVVAATTEEIRVDYSEWPCIRCGECQSACPARLQPQELLIAGRSADHAALDVLGLYECIECGCCDVVCPSHIPLTEIFRRVKVVHRAHERQLQFSTDSAQRFLRREERHRAEAQHARELQEQLIRDVQFGEIGKGALQAAVERARRKRESGTEPD